MSFRDKEKRRGPIDKRTTLDAVHNDKIKTYLGEENSIIDKEDVFKNYQEEYDKLDKISQIELNDTQLQRKLELADTIKKIKKELLQLKSKKERTEYYLQNGSLIFQYYDNKETESSDVCIQSDKENSIINMFHVDEPKKEEKVSTKKIHSKSSILNEYMSYIDDEYLCQFNEKQSDLCAKCNSYMFIIPVQSIMVCKECGFTEEIIINSDKPSYKDPPREVSYFAYKRINHFNEWLAQFQAKESTEIPEEVYSRIIKELNKEKVVDTTTLSGDRLRDILKKLKYNKYYEHVPHIINHLNGEPAPSMSRNTEEKLRMMFKEIQNPFVKYCPKDRKNFLSYSYVLHKFCELLSLDEYLECFPLLKSREKLQQQDNIWEKICYDLQWEYIPST